jgi:hypothetical protein
MDFIDADIAGCVLVKFLFLFVITILPAMISAEAAEIPVSRGDTAFADAAENEWRNTLHADLFARLNPDGVMLSVGGYRRRISGRD